MKYKVWDKSKKQYSNNVVLGPEGDVIEISYTRIHPPTKRMQQKYVPCIEVWSNGEESIWTHDVFLVEEDIIGVCEYDIKAGQAVLRLHPGTGIENYDPNSYDTETLSYSLHEELVKSIIGKSWEMKQHAKL